MALPVVVIEAEGQQLFRDLLQVCDFDRPQVCAAVSNKAPLSAKLLIARTFDDLKP